MLLRLFTSYTLAWYLVSSKIDLRPTISCWMRIGWQSWVTMDYPLYQKRLMHVGYDFLSLNSLNYFLFLFVSVSIGGLSAPYLSSSVIKSCLFWFVGKRRKFWFMVRIPIYHMTLFYFPSIVCLDPMSSLLTFLVHNKWDNFWYN